MIIYFDHEKLHVYQESLNFIAWISETIVKINAKTSVRDQLDRASISIALNIAEGNGKSSMRDRCRFFEISRGSALECSACLDILKIKNLIKTDQVIEGKERLHKIVSMLIKLNQCLLNRISENHIEYKADKNLSASNFENEKEHE